MKLLPQGVMEDQLIDLDEATFIWGPSPKDGMHPCAQVQELKLRCILQHNLWEFKDICHPGGEGVKPTKAEFWPKRWYILQSRPFQKATWQEQHVRGQLRMPWGDIYRHTKAKIIQIEACLLGGWGSVEAHNGNRVWCIKLSTRTDSWSLIGAAVPKCLSLIHSVSNIGHVAQPQWKNYSNNGHRKDGQAICPCSVENQRRPAYAPDDLYESGSSNPYVRWSQGKEGRPCKHRLNNVKSWNLGRSMHHLVRGCVIHVMGLHVSFKSDGY